MPVVELKDREGTSSSSSSSSSSSGSDSSSSNSSSSDDSSSDEDTGSSASASSPKKRAVATRNDTSPLLQPTRSRSCSSSQTRSRPSSISSASSGKSLKKMVATSTTNNMNSGDDKRSKSNNKTNSSCNSSPATVSTSKNIGEEKKPTSNSKVVKSGTVTNTRTIKPLTSMKGKSASIAGKAPPASFHKSKVNKTSVMKKTMAEQNNGKEGNKKLEASAKSVAAGGMKTRASSCSSAASSAGTSSASDSSGNEREPEDSSVTESSPSKPKEGCKLSKPSKPVQKKSVVRNLAAEMLSSADEENASNDLTKSKRKQTNTRRPLTRRQKSGVKKTIPTTTLFNQLLSATNSGAISSSGGVTPQKAAASSSSDVPSQRRSSAIMQHQSTNSTTNTSATSSESESTEQSRKKFPLSTVTTQSCQKNKYLSTWDSDFSDDNFNQQLNNSAANFIRVPAKTSNRPRTIDFSQGLLDPDSYEPPHCPLSSCDSSGHLSGKYPNHNFLSCCPRYHGFEPEECAENEQERARRETERMRYRNILSTPGKKLPKPTSETRAWLSTVKELKENQTRDGLVSQYDLLLWKDSLAIAAERIEKEQNEGISNQGIYHRLSMAVAMGRFEMKCWCASPYPEPLSQNKRLFVCEFCLKPVASGTVLRRHCAKCVWRHPPGDEIYRKDRLSVWEVDGKKQKTYCQNLCLLAKCFLDHKTLYLDVDPFLFYVMTLADNQGCHLVGYFSKEKNSFLNYNVSCILTLPPYMRQGFGRLLIDFSYLLTRVEGKVGSPEKPLSDLGLISYRSYWKDAVLRRMCACASRDTNIKDLSIELGVSTADLISTLQFLGMLKYWKGKHLVLKKQDVLEEYLERVRRRGNERQIDSCCLRWRPYQSPPDENSSSEKS